MLPRYFGGDSRNLGDARGLAARSFRDFVHMLIGAPVVLPITRAQYEKLSDVDRREAKRVAWFCPATFGANPSHRANEFATGAALVVLDLDDPAQAAPLARPETLAAMLQPFSWVAYRTASSKPGAPRLRVVVDAELRPDEYLGAVTTIAAMLGLPGVNPETKRVVQPSFLPSLFADEDPDIDHPMLGSETSGRTFTAADISADYLGSGTSSATSPDMGLDDLAFLRAPMPGITIDVCREALTFLDPDLSMHEWVQVAFALRHQFQGEQEADAYELFLSWSARGKKFVGEEDIAARWRSSKPATKGRAPVTVRSLLRKATQAGWRGQSAVSQAAFAELDAKFSAMTSVTELLEEAPKLLAHSTLSPVERGALCGRIIKAAKALGITISRRDIERSVSQLLKKAVAGDGEVSGKSMPDWARGWVYVSNEDEFFLPTKGTRCKVEPFNRALARNVEEDDDGNSPQPSYLLLREFLCPVVEGYQYDPGRPEDVVFEDEQCRRWCNTYQARYPRGDGLGMDDAARVFQGHLKRLLGDDDSVRRLMDWLAFQVQAPGRKVRWTPLIQGTPGCGKSYIADVMAAVLGRANVRHLDASAVLEDHFNAWGEGSQLVVLEEVRVVGESRHKVMNKLKPLIANGTVMIRRMHTNPYNVKNVTNYLLLTNFLDSLPVDTHDRRYFVLHSPIQTKEQKNRIIAPYLDEMWKCLETNASGLRAMFENWIISPDFNPDGDAPDTASKDELVRNTETPASALLRRLIEDGSNPLITKGSVSLTALRRESEVEGIRHVTEQFLQQVCREAGYTRVVRRTVDGERQRFWIRDEVQVVVEDDDI